MARMVRNDAYLPRSVDELRERGVEGTVLAGLDPGGCTGSGGMASTA